MLLVAENAAAGSKQGVQAKAKIMCDVTYDKYWAKRPCQRPEEAMAALYF